MCRRNCFDAINFSRRAPTRARVPPSALFAPCNKCDISPAHTLRIIHRTTRRTLSKPAMFLFSAKNSAGDFCCTAPPSAEAAFFLGAIGGVCAGRTRRARARDSVARNRMEKVRQTENDSLSTDALKQKKTHAAPARQVGPAARRVGSSHVPRRVGCCGSVSRGECVGQLFFWPALACRPPFFLLIPFNSAAVCAAFVYFAHKAQVSERGVKRGWK